MTPPRPAVLLPLLFVTLLAGFSFWLERRVNLLTQPAPVEPAGEVDLVSGGLVIDVYSEAGLPMHRLIAERATHYLRDDRTALEHPRVTSRREDVYFTGQAQRADVFDGGQRIHAHDDVLVTRVLDGEETRYQGQMLIWWPEDGRARSDLPVLITRGERRASGDRMEAEDHLAKITLIGNAHVFWPPPPSTTSKNAASPPTASPAPRRSPSR